MRRILLALCLCMILNAPAYAENKEALLLDNMSMAQKLEDIAAPILIKNPEICGSYKTTYLGAEFMTLDGVGKSYRELVAQHYNVGDYPTVTLIGKTSPAAAKLKKGDSVRSVNGEVLRRGQAGQEVLMKAVRSGQPLSLHLVRNGKEEKVELSPATICAAQVRLDPQDTDKIYAEKGKVFVTKGALKNRTAAQVSAEVKSQLARYKLD